MLLATCFLMLAAAGPSDGLAAVRSVLQRTEGATSCRDDVLVRRLTALGSGAAPALLGLASGQTLDELLGDTEAEAWLCPPDRVAMLALDALGNLPAVPVRECLRAAATAHPEREVRVAAIDVLGRQGTAEAFPLFLALVVESGEEIELHAVRAHALDALVALLRADAQTVVVLDAALASATLPVQRFACEALGRSGRAEAVRLLMKLVGRDVELDLACLDGASELLVRHPWRLQEDVTAYVRGALEHKDARLRAGAAQVLGRARDTQAVGTLIAHVADDDPAMARVSVWALREITGQKRLATKDEWQTWFTAEREWWQQVGRVRVEELADDGSGAFSAALRELLPHALGRNQLASELVRLLPNLEPGAKAVACAALAQIGALQAVPALVDALSDPEAAVRQAAWKALEALTGEDLPAEPRLWEEFAFG